MSNSKEYKARINRALDYIEANLMEKMQLKDVAKAASFSTYHFHRIFSAMMTEPLGAYIKRLRLERAASQLWGYPDKPITDVALDCGFSTSAHFARAFKEQFGVSASEWRKDRQAHGNSGQRESKPGQVIDCSSTYHSHLDATLTWRCIMENLKKSNLKKAQVEVKDLPEQNVVYVRHVGPYQGDGELFGRLIGKLMMWAGPRDLLGPSTKLMSVYHDNPGLTDDDKLRLSVCLTAPEGTPVDGDIGTMVIAGGRYAIAHFELKQEEYAEAWQAIYAGWLPDSGYQPDDGVPFEVYLNDPKEHPEGKCLVDICVPVKPL